MAARRDALPDRWWEDRETLERILREHGGSNRATASATGVSEFLIRKWRKRHGFDASTHKGNAAPRTGPQPGSDVEIDVDTIDDLDDLLRERGMRREDWVIVRVVVNKWEGFYKNIEADAVKVPLRQLKITLRPRISFEFAQPATIAPLRISKTSTKPKRASRLVFVYGDDQRPNVDRGFEACKLAWITANQPDLILDLGDGADAPTISGHKKNPALSWPLQECINDTASWLYAARCAAPAAEMVLLPDNHFHARLRDYQLAQAASLYGVHPATVDGLEDDLLPLISVERMLRLDEIGVRYMAPPGDTHYAEGHYEIIPGELVAIHGYRTGQNLGKKFIDDYGCSVIYGHAHQQDVYVTDARRRGVGQRRRLYALGVGCGANVHGGGGFAPGADWQNSALTISVFPDGGWTWEPINYEDGVMRWRDQEFHAAAAMRAAA